MIKTVATIFALYGAYFRALGKHITELRKEIGMTQAELVRGLKVSQQTVFTYELGDRHVSVLMLVKLARIFDTRIQRSARRWLKSAFLAASCTH